VIAIGAMSVAMILALRPRWPERWFGGLDKMYRLHKWLGISALVVAIVHWLWAQGPKWAVGWGWLERPVRGERPPIENAIEAFLRSLRGTAEGVGEWAFYAAVLLIALALIQYFPYRFFYKTHRLLAVAYLVLVFHAVVLTKFSYWTLPIGWAMALLLACGTWAAAIVLLRRVGTGRQVEGRIVSLTYYPGVKALESEVEIPNGWPGPQAGPVRLRHVGRVGRGSPLHDRLRLAWRKPEDHLHHQGARRPHQPPAREAERRPESEDRRSLWVLHLRRRLSAPNLGWRRHRHHAFRCADEAHGIAAGGTRLAAVADFSPLPKHCRCR
jgi:hypothetical protein